MYNNNNIDTNSDAITPKPLQDVAKNGKVRPWQEKKLSNVGYYELLEILEFKKAERVSNCGAVLEFDQDQTGYIQLARAWFCKSRLCAMCNWRRAMKQSYQAQQVVEAVMQEKPKARWIFLTFSTKNVADGESLNAEISAMAKGFKAMTRRKKVKQNLIGFMRSTEVTVNESDGTYNQHMHILIAVESTYFKNKDNYITQREWTHLWQNAMKLNYTPVVHVQAIKPKDENKSDMKSAIDETAKYPVKDTDYLTDDHDRNLEVVSDLEEGLRNKRMISYGGLLKTMHAKLNLDDVEEGDLVDPEDENSVSKKAYRVVAAWNWHKQNYFVVREDPIESSDNE